MASEKEVQAVDAAYEADRVTLDLLLDAQRRRAEAESAYYRSLIDYNKAIMNVHYRKGSLLDYNGVYLAEGPWPGKAYFDALREARKRDASMYLDYGFTRPNVISQGPYQQLTGEGCQTDGCVEGMRRWVRHRSRSNGPTETAAAAVAAAAALGVAATVESSNCAQRVVCRSPREQRRPSWPATTSRSPSMNVKRITRLLKLLELLQSGSGQNADGLAKACGVSRRTAFRDIEALRAAGVPVAFDDEHDRYSIPGTYFLPPINFTPAEALSLVALANELGRSDRLPFYEPAQPAARKLEGSLPPALRDELRRDDAGDSHPADARQPAGGQSRPSISSSSTPAPSGASSASSTTASPNGNGSRRSSARTTCCSAATAGMSSAARRCTARSAHSISAGSCRSRRCRAIHDSAGLQPRTAPAQCLAADSGRRRGRPGRRSVSSRWWRRTSAK